MNYGALALAATLSSSTPIYSGLNTSNPASTSVQNTLKMAIQNHTIVATYNIIEPILEKPQTMAFIIKEEVKKRKNYLRIKEIGSLEFNWNKNGADPFPTELLLKTKQIIDEIIQQPKLFPTARDSIQLEYEKENGDYLEFEIFMDNIKVFEMTGEEENEEYIPHDITLINRKVSNFYESQYSTGRKVISSCISSHYMG